VRERSFAEPARSEKQQILRCYAPQDDAILHGASGTDRIQGKLCWLGVGQSFPAAFGIEAATISQSSTGGAIVDIVTERITTADGVGGYLAYPRGQKSPAVLVHFEIFGVNSHIESVCRRIAEAGYAALAPDYYWRLETRTAPYSDMKGGFELAATLKDEQIIADAGSAIRYLRSRDFVEAGAIGTLGFCMGGRVSILVAAHHAQFISAAISFYGGGLAGENMRAGQTLNPMEEAGKVQAPMLLFYGG